MSPGTAEPTAVAPLDRPQFFAARRPWPAIAAWAGVGAALVVLYPSELVRAAGLQRVYLGAHLAALGVVVVSLAGWGSRRKTPGSEHAVMFVLCAVDLARLVPFYGSVFAQWGAFMSAGNAVLYGLLAAVQGGFVWVSRSRSS